MSDLVDVVGSLAEISACGMHTEIADWSVGGKDKKFLMVVKVGSDERPATQMDLENIQDRMKEVTESLGLDTARCVVLVTHHAFDLDIMDVSNLPCLQDPMISQE